ncbi:MAG TPA: hypothetical protein VN453_02070, partial [Feifaniaceae bacterium]|nr:hypothetical protein [Feifaniaceae bacterium]
AFPMVPYPPESNYEVRSSSVTRFKEEIGNEKTNITDGNLYFIFSPSVYHHISGKASTKA